MAPTIICYIPMPIPPRHAGDRADASEGWDRDDAACFLPLQVQAVCRMRMRQMAPLRELAECAGRRRLRIQGHG